MLKATYDADDDGIVDDAAKLGGQSPAYYAVAETVNTELGKKVNVVAGKQLSTEDYTSAEKTKLSGIAAGAEVNQNAFSNIKVGETTVVAGGKTDTVTFEAGDNVSVTADVTGKKITIAGTYQNATTTDAGLMSGDDKANTEVTDNKVTSISSDSTDTQYPSAKAVYTALGGTVKCEVVGTNLIFYAGATVSDTNLIIG